MKGRVLGYDADAGEGIISGDDGIRYRFVPADWKAQGRPTVGQSVDFEGMDGRAGSVFVVSGGNTMSGEKNKIVAALLALFLGGLGIHKFYLGKNTAGIIMLLCSLIGWVLLFIPPMIIGVIAFIEFIIYLVISEEDFERKYVQGNQQWF